MQMYDSFSVIVYRSFFFLQKQDRIPSLLLHLAASPYYSTAFLTYIGIHCIHMYLVRIGICTHHL